MPAVLIYLIWQCSWIVRLCSIVREICAAVQVKGNVPDQLATLATVIGGLIGVGILGYLGLTLSQVG